MSASSQSLRCILSLRLYSSFITSRPGCITGLVFLMSCSCCCSLPLPHGAVGWWSAVRECDISWTKLLSFFVHMLSFAAAD